MKSRYVWAVVSVFVFIGGCSTPEREAASLLKLLPQVSPPVLDEARAVELVKLSLNCVEREFPYKIGYRFDSEEWIKPHYEVTPSFYGCWDWHSAVHGHWTMTKILKMFPNISVGTASARNFVTISAPKNWKPNSVSLLIMSSPKVLNGRTAGHGS